MWLELSWNNDNYSPIEKKEVDLDAFFKWLEKTNKELSKINFLEQTDRKQEEQELNIYEQFFDWEIIVEELQEQIFNMNNLFNSNEISLDTQSFDFGLELWTYDIDEYIEKWKLEIQKRIEKINNKISHLDLILDISWMYKEYLQSILQNIKLKFMSNKDERYEDQINNVEKQIKNISNIIEYLNLIWNTDELLNINTTDLLDKLIVSEEKIQDLWYFDHPFLLTNWKSVEDVNTWYETIKQWLQNPNLTNQDIKNLKTNIFKEIRNFDWLDDDKHKYNSSEAIRTRITWNILNNQELNQDIFIKTSFDFIKNFNENDKQELYKSLSWWKDNFKSFLEKNNVFKNLWITNERQQKILLNQIFYTLEDWNKNLNDEQLKIKLQEEINKKIEYLKEKKDNSLNKEETQKAIDGLENSINTQNLNKVIETIKQETIFKSFERILISQTLSKKSSLVKQIWQTNENVNLYKEIEWIWEFNMSDETFNSISVWTQFLAEQIVIMYASWLIWNAFKSVLWAWETLNLFKWWMTLKNIWKIWLNTMIEWWWFYLWYTQLNWLVNKQEFNQILDDLNTYDAVRTIVFLWVLRSINKTGEKFSLKNITLDTVSILWTDIAIRWVSQLVLWKDWEWIKWVDFNDLKNTNFRKLSKFLIEELEFIIPLVIWLRLAEWWLSKTNKKIEVIPTKTEFVIKWLQKEIRILRQERNIARKKKKNTKEINEKLKDKKSEYKELRDSVLEENQSISNNNQKENHSKLIPENKQKVEKWDNKKSEKESNADKNTSTNKWAEQKYADLARYSKKVQDWKIDYALKDWEIQWVLTEKWIWDKWKSVWEWLLKKSWFKESEIDGYNKWELKSEKAKKSNEREALREMEKANEVIYKEYKDITTFLIKWEKLPKKYGNLGNEFLYKIEDMMNKEKMNKYKSKKRK